MSDQDFFFDEDEKPAEKPAAKPAGKPAATTSSAKSVAAPAAMGERTVSMTIAGLIGVVALLAGIIIGMFAAPDSAKVPGTTANPQSAAPQLTDEQIQQGLPANHPDISGAAGGQPTSTGEATGTGE